jgi:3-keto-5-aminohexanoate cleavage enzyme
MDKLVITVSPSGQAPNLPSQPDMRVPKLHADAILEGFNAGASVVHIRGTRVTEDPKIPQGLRGPTLDNWKEVTNLVRSRCDIVVNFGSSAMEPNVRKPLLALKPDSGSFLVGHHYGGMSVPVEKQRRSALDHLEAGVLPEVEIFHTGDMANLNMLIKTGVIRPPYCVTLFFDYTHYYSVPATLPQLQNQLALLPPNTHWTVCVKGPKHLEMAAYAIVLGGHVRTGLENEVELAPGRLAKSQRECVERIVRLAQDLGRPVATPQEAREMLGLPRKPEKSNG